jgi:hypothetical protein
MTREASVRRVAFGLVAVSIMLAGCSGKKRPFADGVGGSSATDIEQLNPDATAPGSNSGAPASAGESNIAHPLLLTPGNGISPGSLGAPCASGAECNAPGQCVDGVCCSAPCTELCAACNVPGSVGTCSAAPSDDACGTLQCAGVDTECRKLDPSQLALNCDAFGVCKINPNCAVLPETTSTTCQAGAGACDGTGACLVAGKASLGETCAADADCAEGHCVIAAEGGAGVCCDAACDSPCQACSAAGHCEETPTSDLRCEAVACPVDDVCRNYTADVTASECRAFGQCQTGRDCEHIALRPDAECECDATSGVCRLRGGAACTDAAECGSGVCTANAQGTTVCCASGCAPGLFCSSDGSACVACEGTAVECDGNTQRACNAGAIASTPCPNGCTPGIGCNVLPPVGFPCDGGQCAAPNVCQEDVTGVARCCSRNCAAEGKVCGANGSCECQAGQVAAGSDCLLQDGEPCQTSQQCQVGSSCTDGVCCQEACNGGCERCEPNTGLCVAVAQGQQDDQCTNGRQCTGARGDCRLTVRQTCSGNGAECTTNNCEPTVGNTTQICCTQACSGNRPFCRSTGQGCVQCETNADCGNGCNTQTGLCNDLLPLGTPCGTSSQCASGAQCLLDQSSQTRCCESNCAQQGLLCNGAGRCVAPAPATLATIGTPPTEFPRTLTETTSTTTRLWTVQNAGGSATAPLSRTLNAEFPLNGNCIGQALQPGASCTLTVGFSPSQPGARSATLTLNGGQGVAVSVGVRGEARVRNGAPCPSNAALCDGGTCTEWFADPDGDGFGSSENVGGFPSATICGTASLANQPPPFVFEGGCRGADAEIPYVLRNTTLGIENGGLDCCDRFFRCDPSGSLSLPPNSARPGVTTGSAGVLACGSAPAAGLGRDFNCDGDPVPVATVNGSGVVTNCTQPRCAERFNKVRCDLATAAACTQNSGVQGPEVCGIVTNVGCSLSAAGTCQTQGAGQISVVCL